MNDNRDAFDLWWEWAEKPVDSMLIIDAAVHDAVMALPPDERRDRAKVNEAVRKLARDRNSITGKLRKITGIKYSIRVSVHFLHACLLADRLSISTTDSGMGRSLS